MHHNRPFPKVTHRSETGVGTFGPTSTTGGGQPGQRTVGGAVATLIVSVAVVVAASSPTITAVVVAVAVGVFAVTRDGSRDSSSEIPRQERDPRNRAGIDLPLSQTDLDDRILFASDQVES